MSLYGALFAGVSGLSAQSNTLSVISNNIANVNTVGFKGATGSFESLVTSSAGAAFSPGGVLANTNQDISLQGQLQTSGSPTDIGILGNGFFVVSTTSSASAGQVLYTRAGDFTQDSSGNFKNSAGFYLQAWPLDRNGLLPGAAGNTTDTTSSANLSSLQTVNVNNLTGSASATTKISIGANLQASALSSLGSGATASLDSSDLVNYNAGTMSATGIIVPTTQDHLTIGDSFTVSTSGSVNQTYVYGGFAVGTDVTGPVTNPTTTLSAQPFTIGATAGGQTTVTVKVGSVSGLTAGQVISLGTPTANTVAIDGIAASAFNGNFVISNINTVNNTFDIKVTGTPVTGAITSMTTDDSGSGEVITVTQVGSNLQSGDKVTITGAVPPAGSSLTGAQINGNWTVTAVDADHYKITIGTAETTVGGATGGSATESTTSAGSAVSYDPSLFTGKILNATSTSSSFLGTTPTSSFTTAALSFNVVVNGATTSTFTYTAGTPNASQGQFNTLANLATAINASPNGLTARVVDGKLYVGSVNASDGVTFTNGSTVGVSGPPVQAGIDWVGALGLSTIAQATNANSRFSSLQGLANDINANVGLTASISSAAAGAELHINVNNPLDTITFADNAIGTSPGNNTGSVLAALGLTYNNGATNVTIPTLAGITPTGANTATTGVIAPSYSASDPNKSISSGNTVAQFSHPVQIYDSQGTAHNINVGFIKTGTGDWAVEVYAVPASDLQVSSNGGQLAAGNLSFNGDGTLASVSSDLTTAIPIHWANGALDSSISLNWGTFGPVGVGKTDGMSQFDSAYIVNFANQNGVPVGQLSSVAIDKDGFITASYSNGQTQKLFKIPLAQFTNPNQLDPLSSNVYAQSEASGEVNLAEAGTGGAGTIASSSLEASNVELADELTTMIIAQRSYEANTKVISTADNLLQALNQIIQ